MLKKVYLSIAAITLTCSSLFIARETYYSNLQSQANPLLLENLDALCQYAHSNQETDGSMRCWPNTDNNQSTMNLKCSDCSFHWGYPVGDASSCKNSY